MKRFGQIPQVFFNTGDGGGQAASQGGGSGSGQAADGAQQGAQQQGQQGAAQGGQQQQGAGGQGDGQQSQQQQGQQGQGQQQQGAGDSGQQQQQQAQVPETYELTLPDGTTLDQTDVDAIATIAKTNKWSNEQAQRALTEMHQQLAEQSTRFRTELDADSEVGGAHLEQAQQHANRTLDRFLPKDTPEGAALRTAMTKSGYGNYLPLVKLLARIGKAMGEDRPGQQQAQGGGRRSHAEVLFGDAAR